MEGEAVAEAGTALDTVEDGAAAGPVQAHRRTGELRAIGSPGELDAHIAQDAAGTLRALPAADRPPNRQHARRYALQARNRALPEGPQTAPDARPAVLSARRPGNRC